MSEQERSIAARGNTMPDGDRFEWKLRGKGWRKVYRLLTSKTGTPLVAGCVLTGVAAYIRKNNETPYSHFIDVIHEALSAPVLNSLPPESVLSGSTKLAGRLDTLVANSKFVESAQFAQRSALKAFLRLDAERGNVTREDVAKHFGSELSWELAESQCIGIVRDKVTKETGRTIEEQVRFEANLREEVSKAGQDLGKQLTEDRDMSNVRAPRKRVVRKELTVEDLHKPLSVDLEIRNE
jgi:hypothetical protein